MKSVHKIVHKIVDKIVHKKTKDMIVISPTELRAEQKKYLDLAEVEQVIVKRGTKLIELVVRDRSISDADIQEGLSLDEVRKQVHRHIDKKFKE